MEPADEGVHSIDVVAARGALCPPPCFECEVRDARVLRDPLVGDEPVRAEHRIRHHHGQQGTADRRLARVGDGLEGSVASAIGCREELLLPGPPAPRRRYRRTAHTPIGPPPQARRHRVVHGVTPVPDLLPRLLSALALVGFVGFDDASKGGVGLRLQSADDRHPPASDAVTRRTQHLGPAAAGHRLRRLDHVTRQRDHQVGAVNPGQRRAAAA